MSERRSSNTLKQIKRNAKALKRAHPGMKLAEAQLRAARAQGFLSLPQAVAMLGDAPPDQPASPDIVNSKPVSFTVTGPLLHVGDPMYGLRHPELCLDLSALPGRWLAHVGLGTGGHEGLVLHLLAHHESIANTDCPWTLVGEVPVDSATMSLVSRDFAEQTDLSDFALEELDDPRWNFGPLSPHGVASTSGWGDSRYPVFADFDANGKVVAVEVEFVSLSELDEDE